MELDTLFLQNSIYQYLRFTIVALGGIITFQLIQYLVLNYFKRLAKKTDTQFDDTMISIIASLKIRRTAIVIVYLSSFLLTIEHTFSLILQIIAFLAAVSQIIEIAKILVEYSLVRQLPKTGSKLSPSLIRLSKTLTGFALWAIGLLFILSNLGVNVTSLIAGLGVGGLAVALALQNILGDLFSSLAIMIDKPFTEGDMIETGTDRGTVEKIGMKTTRIRSQQGEELIISNQELTNVRVKNFKRITEFRCSVELGVAYNTPDKKLRKIPTYIQDIIEAFDNTTFERAHLNALGASALIFKIVFYVHSEDPFEFRDIRQEALLQIIEALRKQKVEIAFPTQTVHIATNNLPA